MKTKTNNPVKLQSNNPNDYKKPLTPDCALHNQNK